MVESNAPNFVDAEMITKDNTEEDQPMIDCDQNTTTDNNPTSNQTSNPETNDQNEERKEG